MDFAKKYWPTILAILLGLGGMFTETAKSYVSAHPALAGALVGIIGLINHWLPSPTSSSTLTK